MGEHVSFQNGKEFYLGGRLLGDQKDETGRQWTFFIRVSLCVLINIKSVSSFPANNVSDQRTPKYFRSHGFVLYIRRSMVLIKATCHVVCCLNSKVVFLPTESRTILEDMNSA